MARARGIAEDAPVGEVGFLSCRGGDRHSTAVSDPVVRLPPGQAETSQIADVGMFPKFRKVSIPLVGEVVGLGWWRSGVRGQAIA